ncbi:zinc-binding dehydrogenase [Mesorhizobium sp. DCY119]|uniref:quinone oxidoreductase family protein n=1 Tax=Mesorhizobium sp. DCY119 TaxID=2108445 RepID=UPI000E6CB003|nr:zinc-binding dehydrogenase [Mesorhizobium sp. DCY119]RJG42902.1 zinc-binding alcohol dehydrogenase family protein [Mesorhizobium sp. DCY119]
MKAVQLSRFGGPDVLEIIEVPAPVPAPGEVLVRVRASGVNFFEVLMRRDRYAVTPDLPMIFGAEVAGVVEALGADVGSVEIGARVAVPMFAIGRGSGGYAEYVAVDAASVVRLPDNLSFEDAAALMIQGLTALHLIRQSPPKDKTVLVNAAAGGVGSLLVQLATRAGAKCVIAAASTQEKRDLARSLGADIPIDYTASDWAGRVRDATGGIGADIVYEFVGGALTRASLEALAPCGEIVFGALGRFDLDAADLEGMFNKNQSLRGFALLPLLTPANLKSDLAELFEEAASGRLKVLQGVSYPLDQAAEAHKAIEERRTTGKVVLIP